MQPTSSDHLTATLKADTTRETWVWACAGVCGSTLEAARADLLRVDSAWPTCPRCNAVMALRVEMERGQWWMHKTYQVLPERTGTLVAEQERHDISWGGGSVPPEHRALDYAFTRAAFARNDVRATIPAEENTPERNTAFYSLVCAFAWMLMREAKASGAELEQRTLQNTVRWIFNHRRRLGLTQRGDGGGVTQEEPNS